jgi:biopolymer transport protein ExbB
MIRLFEDVKAVGLGDATMLSGGISEAMITTAAGLMIGIPALVGFYWLQGRADAIIFELERYATQVLDTLRERRLRGAARAGS